MSEHQSAEPRRSQPPLAELPLADLRVVELGQLLAGPFCGQLLGDFGAEVIKVEDPGRGDPMREWGREKPHGKSLWWPVVARNKKSVTCNLRVARGPGSCCAGCSTPPTSWWRTSGRARWSAGGSARTSCGRPTRGLIITRVTGYGQTGPVRAAGRVRLDRRGDGRHPLRHRRSRPAAGPGRDLARRLAGGDLRLPRHAGRACTTGSAPAAARWSTRPSTRPCWP